MDSRTSRRLGHSNIFFKFNSSGIKANLFETNKNNSFKKSVRENERVYCRQNPNQKNDSLPHTDCLFPISLQPNVVHLSYFKL